jgi:hypothetical protein
MSRERRNSLLAADFWLRLTRFAQSERLQLKFIVGHIAEMKFEDY